MKRTSFDIANEYLAAASKGPTAALSGITPADVLRIFGGRILDRRGDLHAIEQVRSQWCLDGHTWRRVRRQSRSRVDSERGRVRDPRSERSLWISVEGESLDENLDRRDSRRRRGRQR
jgi:hypothetical protein